VSFAAIALCVAPQRVFFVVYFVIDSVWKLLDTPSYFNSSRGPLGYATAYSCGRIPRRAMLPSSSV
jgi:hypothetical protein